MIRGYILLPTGAVVTVQSPPHPIVHLESAGPPEVQMYRPIPSGLAVVATPGAPGRQGDPGPPGVSSGVNRVTAIALSGHRVVVPDSSGEVLYASPSDAGHVHKPMWLTTAAWAEGVTASLTSEGLVTEGSWNWTPGVPIYLGINGALTQTPPGGAFLRIVATVVSPTTIDFNPQTPIVI